MEEGGEGGEGVEGGGGGRERWRGVEEGGGVWRNIITTSPIPLLHYTTLHGTTPLHYTTPLGSTTPPPY